MADKTAIERKFGSILSTTRFLYSVINVYRKITTWKVSKYRIFSGPYFPVFILNTGKYGPEKTPYLNTFYAVKLKNQIAKAWNVWNLILGSLIKYVRRIYQKNNISNTLIRTPARSYQGVRKNSFSENLAHVLMYGPFSLRTNNHLGFVKSKNYSLS